MLKQLLATWEHHEKQQQALDKTLRAFAQRAPAAEARAVTEFESLRQRGFELADWRSESRRRQGRQRWNSLNPVPLREVLRKWIGANEEHWADGLLNIRDVAEADRGKEASNEGEAS